jgi:hypothetical protein
MLKQIQFNNGAGVELRARGKITCYVDTAAVVLIVILIVSPVVLVLALFIWGAVKDGEEDKAVQARLGIRRRTRLGR